VVAFDGLRGFDSSSTGGYLASLHAMNDLAERMNELPIDTLTH
jgi:hypothetical protein